MTHTTDTQHQQTMHYYSTGGGYSLHGAARDIEALVRAHALPHEVSDPDGEGQAFITAPWGLYEDESGADFDLVGLARGSGYHVVED